MTTTRRMTVAQALVAFLSQQWTVDGEVRVRTIPGVFGILGHGNVAGVGQALQELAETNPGALPLLQARNEQAMVHQAVGYARMMRRRSTFASTSSVGPGSTNMITGAALATTNRLPALLLPSDTFATRRADPVLQQLEQPHDSGLTVNDAFRPVSRYFDRVNRPEQLYSIALNAMRVLTDPADTGAVTISLPQDVQTEAMDVPLEFLEEREWRIRRPRPERDVISAAAAAIRGAQRPLIIAGGGVLYSDGESSLRQWAASARIPVATTQAGGGVMLSDDEMWLGGAGVTGSTAANRLARDADVIIGIGTRFSDFTTASRSLFQAPDVTFITINIAPIDAAKHGAAIAIVADARESIVELAEALEGWSTSREYQELIRRELQQWQSAVDVAVHPSGRDLPGQPEVVGAINAACDARDVVVQAAGSLPGDLHKLWRVRDALGYHVEYAFSCMGYEIAGGLGVKRAAPDRDVIVLVGDASYLMMHSELITAVAEGIPLVVVLVQNHGYASIGRLSESVGSQRFQTAFGALDSRTGAVDGAQPLPIDLAANARSYGVDVIEVAPGPNVTERITEAVEAAKGRGRPCLVHIDVDPLVNGPSSEAWWDVPVAEVSLAAETQNARAAYTEAARSQRPLLG